MNKKWKHLAAAAGLLVAAGVLLFGLSLLFGARPARLLDGTLRFPSWVSVGSDGVSFAVDDDGDPDWAPSYRADGVYSVPAEGVRAIEIDWVAGTTEVLVSHEDAIEFSETASPISESLRWSLDDGVLHIRYSRGGLHTMGTKTLRLSLPAALAAKLEEFDFSSASGSLSLSGITAEELSLSSSSGSLNAWDVAAGQVSLDSSSGALTLSGRFDELDASSSSGAVAVSCTGGAERVSVESVSGGVVFSGEAGELYASASSGALELSLSREPEELLAETSSGPVTLTLPADCGFTLAYDSSSGDLDCAFPVRMEDGRYTCGSGRAELQVSTSSGDLSVFMAD